MRFLPDTVSRLRRFRIVDFRARILEDSMRPRPMQLVSIALIVATMLCVTVATRILLQGDRPLLNIYSVMEVKPANGPKVNANGGEAFAELMVAPNTQAVIKTFGVDEYGQPLFVPVAGMREDQIG